MMQSRLLGRMSCSRMSLSVPRASGYRGTSLGAFENVWSSKRCFSVSGMRRKELRAMSEEELGGVKVQQERLMRDIHETCEWGIGERWGR